MNFNFNKLSSNAYLPWESPLDRGCCVDQLCNKFGELNPVKPNSEFSWKSSN